MPSDVRDSYWKFLLNSGPSPPAGFTIYSYMDDTKCIDLPGGDAYNGAKLWVWECNGTPQQQWIFAPDSWRIESAVASGKCIDAGNGEDGEQLYLWDCNGLSQQAWGYDANEATIYMDQSEQGPLVATPATARRMASSSNVSIPRASKCLDLSGGDTSEGTAVQVWDCNGRTNQQWGLGGSAAKKQTQQRLGSGGSAANSSSPSRRPLLHVMGTAGEAGAP